jgi:hypothetical protein
MNSQSRNNFRAEKGHQHTWARAHVPFPVQTYSLAYDPVSGEDWHGGFPFSDVFEKAQLAAAVLCTDPATCSHLDYTGNTQIYEGALFVVSQLVR